MDFRVNWTTRCHCASLLNQFLFASPESCERTTHTGWGSFQRWRARTTLFSVNCFYYLLSLYWDAKPAGDCQMSPIYLQALTIILLLSAKTTDNNDLINFNRCNALNKNPPHSIKRSFLLCAKRDSEFMNSPNLSTLIRDDHAFFATTYRSILNSAVKPKNK